MQNESRIVPVQCSMLSSEGRCTVAAPDGRADHWEAEPDPFDWTKLKALPAELRQYYRLLGALFAIGVLAILLIYFLAPRKYTAVAVIGPPGPSPTGTLLAGGGAAGIGSKILGGAGAGDVNDPYDSFQQLVPSTRLSQVLIDRDHILQTIFYRKWDFDAKRWERPGPLKYVANGVKSLLDLPVSDTPNVDDLTEFFDHNLAVDQTGGPKRGLLGGDSPYLEVSFEYEDPKAAERLLATILLEADRIIREDQRRDVTSRIVYLRKALLSEQLAADDRTALISVLSNQEQLLSMIEADQRYASTLVVPPYASLTPTFPPSPLALVAAVVALSTMLWSAIVFLSLYLASVRRWIAWARFEVGRAGVATADALGSLPAGSPRQPSA